MSLPTASEINPIPEDLDGRAAQEHFLGKTFEDAVRLFQENSLFYLEDLLWMGPKAFCYYFPAAAHYLKSDAGEGDTDALRCLASIIHSRIHDDGVLVSDIYPVIQDLADFVIQNRKQFDTSLSFYRLEIQAYRDILQALNGEQGAAPNSRSPSELPTSSEVQTPDSQRTPSSGGCG
jgi:hypothetical protein